MKCAKLYYRRRTDTLYIQHPSGKMEFFNTQTGIWDSSLFFDIKRIKAYDNLLGKKLGAVDYLGVV